MAETHVTFRRCLINPQALRGEDPEQDHLISRVVFDVSLGPRTCQGVVDVRQPYGADYATTPLEVRLSTDSEYRGPFPPASFGEALARYYRRLVAQQVRFVASGDRARDLARQVAFTERDGPHIFVLPEGGGGWALGDAFIRLS